jgi:hypothetical protein
MTSPANSPKTPTRTVLAFLVPGCGLLLALGVVVLLAGFFWPGYFRTPPAALVRIDDPLTLLPADSNWVLGADLDKLRAGGTLEPILDFLANPPAGFANDVFSAGMADIVRDGQSLLIAGTAGDDKSKPVIILATRGPADVEKIKKECHAGAEQRMHGFTAYRTQIGKGEPGKKIAPGWLAFPSDCVVLLSEAAEPDFAALLAAASKPSTHRDAASIRAARAAPLWSVLHFDARMKRKLTETLPKDMGELAAALQKGRGAILQIEFPNASANARLDVMHGNDADAAELAKAGQKSWSENKALLQGAVFLMGLQKHPATGLLRDLTRTLSIDANGTRASATMQLTEKTLQELEKKQK